MLSKNFQNNFNQTFQSPFIGLGGGFSLFEYDENTYYFDFETDITNANLVNTAGDDTLTRSPDAIANAIELVQNVKDFQPLVDSPNGVEGTSASDRHFKILQPTLTNGTSGIYIACNFYKRAAGRRIVSVTNGTNSVESRVLFQIAGNNSLGFSARTDEAGSPPFQAYSSGLTNDVWYTGEAKFVCDGATTTPCTLWIDGSEPTYGFRNTTTAYSSYNASDPNDFLFMNDFNGFNPFDGGIQKMVIYNGIIPDAIRQSISDYLVSVKPT